MLALKECTDASVTEYVKLRYDDGQFYHSVGSVFISVNPVHALLKGPQATSNEDPQLLQKFLNGNRTGVPQVHWLRFAHNIYSSASIDRVSQTIIFRGCCGSGKTELIKSTIQYLLSAESTKKDVSLNVNSVQPLGSVNNPMNLPTDSNRCAKAIATALSLYDIMGNAMTENNTHSSRHLKHLKLMYDSKGKLYGAQLTSLLTDLMRFDASGSTTTDAAQPQHPVYLMLLVAAGLGSRAEEFKITKAHRDAFLPPGSNKSYVELLEQQFHYFHESLLASQIITEDDWNSCLRAVAACINLQCVVLSGSETASISMSTKQYVANAEELLGLEAGSLTTLILKRPDDRIGRTSGSLVESKPAEGKVVLDALSRIIYGRTFKFCLQHCSMQSFPSEQAFVKDVAGTGPKDTTAVHILDLPGWEQLEASVTGQVHHLLLHYVEEKLHGDYICACFTEEIEKYALEEVEVGFVEYPDSGPALDILEKSPTGIIFLLEEASAQIKVNDRALVDKILTTHMKTKLVKSAGARAAATAFIIKHTFADINYDCEGFITQNKQSHLPDIAITTLGTSTISFIAADVAMALQAEINPPMEDNKRSSVGRIKGPSTANFLMTKTKTMMNNLLEKLAETDKQSYGLCLSTGKCVKEGTLPVSAFTSTEYVKEQVKYFALPSLITFAQKGFVYAKLYVEFYHRFRSALALDTPNLPCVNAQNEKIIASNAVALSKLLVQNLLPMLMKITVTGKDLSEEDEPVYGKTTVFIRDRLASALEEYRSAFIAATNTVALQTQAAFRMHKQRVLYKTMRRGVVALQSIARCRSSCKMYNAKRRLVNTLKALYRMSLCRRRYQLMYKAISLIKRKFTGPMAQRIRYKRLQRARRCLQGLAKGFMIRSFAIKTFQSMLTLQRAAKAFLKRRRYANLLLASTQKVQNRFRGYLVRVKFAPFIKVLAIRRQQRIANKVVRQLQALWRGKLVTKRFMEVFCATIRLQAWARMRSERSKFLRLVKLAIWLQCGARRIVAHNRAHSIVVNRMVESELGLLADLFKREVASIRAVPNNQRSIGSGYLRNTVNKFERFLISFDVNFDLSFAYPNGWLSTVLDFSKRLREDEKKIIAKIVTGSHHTVILDDAHNIYTFGLGDLGQLGHNNRASFPTPHKIEKLGQYLASAGAAATLTNSTIATSPTPGNSGGVHRGLSQNIAVKDIACGKDHSMLLSASGVVYSWGDNRRGQLGHGKYESCSMPRLVGGAMNKDTGLRSLKHVKMICCGDYHSAVLVEPGCVYTWGRGMALGRASKDPYHLVYPGGQQLSPMRRGSLASVASTNSFGGTFRNRSTSVQLSVPPVVFDEDGPQENDSSQPDIVSFFQRRRVQYICSGQGHIMARAGADLYAWGDNSFGQLGDGTTEHSALPVKVLMRPLGETEALSSELVSGGRHNVLLCNGEVWSWGWNKYGAVGNGSIDNVLKPTRVNILGTSSSAAGGTPPKPAPQFIISINVGLRHTMALSSSQLLFGWGMVNLTNATAPAAAVGGGPASPQQAPGFCERSVASELTPASHTTPQQRRFSVFCDASSTSELYLLPTQVVYSGGVQNPFSEGRLIALHGCSSSSLGYVTVDAEVPLVMSLSQASVSGGPRLLSSKSLSASKLTPTRGAEALTGKAKLQATANTVRRALMFSPRSQAKDKTDDGTISEATISEKSDVAAGPKPLFNPFLKDHNVKTDPKDILANKMREAVKALRYVPGVAGADAKSQSHPPSAEAKGNLSKGNGAVTPNTAFKPVTSPRGAAGHSLGASGGPRGSISPKERLSSLSQSVYSQKRASEAMEQMSLYAPFSNNTNESAANLLFPHGDGSDDPYQNVETVQPAEPVDLTLAEDDLLDLFSPLNLTSIRNRRAHRKRDITWGSSVRDYFSIFVQKEVPVPAAEEVRFVPKKEPTEKKPAVPAASGVGMPKAEKAFLQSFSNNNKGISGSSAIQPTDGLINLTSITSVSPTNSGPMASYQTPTLSYSWRLATRRKSTSVSDMNQAAIHAQHSSHGKTSPLPNRREWSPPPRSRPSPGQHSSLSANKSPSRTATTPVADPADSLGLDKAIQQLQSSLHVPRGNGRRNSLF